VAVRFGKKSASILSLVTADRLAVDISTQCLTRLRYKPSLTPPAFAQTIDWEVNFEKIREDLGLA
jgi:hypothetical protein